MLRSNHIKDHTLILASQSKTRQKMLKDAHVKFKVIKPVLDEMAVAQDMMANKIPVEKIGLELAKRKALSVAGKNPDALVIGSDQILIVEGRLMSKARNKEEAKDKPARQDP
jgi:septum formation protein